MALSQAVEGLSGVVTIETGEVYNLELQADGIAWSWGSNEH